MGNKRVFLIKITELNNRTLIKHAHIKMKLMVIYDILFNYF